MTKDTKNGDAMAEAIARQGGGKTQEQIDSEAVAKSRAISDDERATIRKMQEDQAEREKLRPVPPVTKSTSAENARPGEETVTMIFPRAMFIWAEPNEKHPSRLKVNFEKGPQEVPVSLSDNWYLWASGVKPYEGPVHEKGPTVQEWVNAGYPASKYPPPGCASRSTPEEIQALVDKESVA